MPEQKSHAMPAEMARGEAQAPQRRSTPQAPQSLSHQPATPKRRNSAATRDKQKDGRTSSPDSPRRRLTKSAYSSWKSKQRAVYDAYLGRHPIPAVTTPNLMEQMVEDANMISAVKAINSKPKKAAGVDGLTVRDVCEPLLDNGDMREALRKQLLEGDYRPDAVRLKLIPKPNGKKRKLGIAIVSDRIVQRMLLQVVEANLPDSPWSHHSYAYHKDTGIADAIKEVDSIIADGYKYAICIDLKAFFDNVPHDRLKAKLKHHIADRRVCNLVASFLTPVVVNRSERYINRKGTPQGSVVSPWLASDLYLGELDSELEARGHRFVRYADDCTIFCHSLAASKRTKARIIEFIEDVMGCPVNREKTKIVPVGRMDILGLYRKGNKWHLKREKEQEACNKALGLLSQFVKSGRETYREKAIQRFSGFLNHYRHIPDLAAEKVPALTRWFLRKCEETWKKRMAAANKGTDTPF